tara:strand:+ start:2314 stop:2694 length:381 start_codon:yes stop_codon:yes gene_type:complete
MEKEVTIEYHVAVGRLAKYVSEKVIKEKKVSTELLRILRAFIEVRNISYVAPSMKRDIKLSIEQAFNTYPEILEAITVKDSNTVDTVFIKDSHFEVTSVKPEEDEGIYTTEPKKVVVECSKKDVII